MNVTVTALGAPDSRRTHHRRDRLQLRLVISADCKRASGKGPRQKMSKIVKKCQKKSCRPKVPRIFRIFVPNFAPNFAPNFSRIFRGLFVLGFVGDGDQKNSPKIPPFFNAKFPGKHEKNIHKVLLESRQSNKKCQKVFRHFSTIFAQGKKTSQIVKKCQKVFDNFRMAPVFRPLLGGSDNSGGLN